MPTLRQIMWAHVSKATGEIVDLMRIRPHLSGPIGTTTVEVVVQEHNALNESAERLAHAAEVAGLRAALEVMQAYLTGPVEFEAKAPELYALWIDEQQGLNCGGYLRLYVESALAADPGPLVAAVEGLVGALEGIRTVLSGAAPIDRGIALQRRDREEIAEHLKALDAYRAALKGEVERG